MDSTSDVEEKGSEEKKNQEAALTEQSQCSSVKNIGEPMQPKDENFGEKDGNEEPKNDDLSGDKAAKDIVPAPCEGKASPTKQKRKNRFVYRGIGTKKMRREKRALAKSGKKQAAPKKQRKQSYEHESPSNNQSHRPTVFNAADFSLDSIGIDNEHSNEWLWDMFRMVTRSYKQNMTFVLKDYKPPTSDMTQPKDDGVWDTDRVTSNLEGEETKKFNWGLQTFLDMIKHQIP